MRIVDAQLHEPAISLDWSAADTKTKHNILTEVQLAYMDAVGVDHALLHPVDFAWGEHATRHHSDRFSLIATVGPSSLGCLDPRSSDIAAIISKKRKIPGLVAVRAVLFGEVAELDLFQPTCAACERQGLPLFLFAGGDLEPACRLAERHPALTVIIDYLGLQQPGVAKLDSSPMPSLQGLMGLAHYPNIAIKLSGTAALSDKPFPYTDLEAPLRQLIGAFGADRLMWASDISRHMGRSGFGKSLPSRQSHDGHVHNYAESLFFLREAAALSSEEKAALLGDTVRRLLKLPDPPKD